MEKETVGKIEQLTTVELTELVPYADDRELTDDVLEELGFTKVDMTIEETGADEDFYYYELELFPNDVKLFPYEKPEFKTAGGIKTLLMALQGE